MPEIEEVDEITIDKGELRVDTFRASGAGGQHVNKTDSAIRITHLPTGIVVECQDERSQHKNRARAMSLLQAKLLDKAQSEQTAEQAEQRRSLVGSGDRSEKIRTYNYPDGRVTDHRINLTLHRLQQIMAGELEAVIDPSPPRTSGRPLKRNGSRWRLTKARHSLANQAREKLTPFHRLGSLRQRTAPCPCAGR